MLRTGKKQRDYRPYMNLLEKDLGKQVEIENLKKMNESLRKKIDEISDSSKIMNKIMREETVTGLQDVNKLKTIQIEEANKRIIILGKKIGRLEKENTGLHKEIKSFKQEGADCCCIF